MTKYEEILKELETTTTMEGLRFAASGVAVCEDMGKITHEEAISLRQTIGCKMCEMEFHQRGWTTLKEDIEKAG